MKRPGRLGRRQSYHNDKSISIRVVFSNEQIECVIVFKNALSVVKPVACWS